MRGTRMTKRLGVGLLLAAGVPLAWAGDPPPEPLSLHGGVFGLDDLSLQGGPVTFAQLGVVEETLPDHFYRFEVADAHRLDSSRFDPFLDTPPFENWKIEEIQAAHCFGMSNQVLEWHQLWLRGTGRDRPDPRDRAGNLLATVHLPAAMTRDFADSRAPDPVLRLREYTRSDAGAAEVLRRVVELQPTQYRLGELAPPGVLIEDYVLRDLRYPHVGATQINIIIKDLAGNPWMPHSWLAYRAYEGVALGDDVLVKLPDGSRAIRPAPKSHKVRATRIDLWDPNTPYATRAKAEDSAHTPYLIYFPRAQWLCLPRNAWYDHYEQFALWHHEANRVGGSDERLRRHASKALLQRNPSFLSDEALVQFPDVNSNQRRSERQAELWRRGSALGRVKAVVKADGARVEDGRRAALLDRHSRGVTGQRSLEAHFWGDDRDIQEEAVEQAVDAFLLESFHVPESRAPATPPGGGASAAGSGS